MDRGRPLQKGRKKGVNIEGSEEIGEWDVYMRLAMREMRKGEENQTGVVQVRRGS